jgi:uncharacterized protein YecE (DUF72 family)
VTPGTLYAGASSFSFASWRGGFYPADARPEDFLRHYAGRLPSVELNTTGYRLPKAELFDRWAAQTPAGFRFAVKMPAYGLRALGDFEERVGRLGERLGPVRVVLQSARDDGLLALLLGSADPGLRYALDLRHESWDGVDVSPAVRIDDLETDAPFRYLRFREPPYDDTALARIAAEVAPELAAGRDVYAYFRHEDEPTAPLYAERLLELVGAQLDSE